MKNGVIYGIIGFAAGVAIGGYAVGRMCVKRYKELIKELEEKNEELAEEIEKTAKKAVSEPLKPIVEAKSDQSDILSNYKTENDEDEDDEYFDPDDIYLIDVEEFKKECTTREDETITWYTQDNVLANAYDMPIHDEEKVIGVEAMDELANHSDEKDFLYVCNDYDHKVYEIVVERNIGFYNDILGIEKK